MLQRYVTHEEADRIVIGPELEDDPCVRCGGESVVGQCAGDGRLHHHGRVHTREGGLEALCEKHLDAAAAEWNMARAEWKKVATRSPQ